MEKKDIFRICERKLGVLLNLGRIGLDLDNKNKREKELGDLIDVNCRVEKSGGVMEGVGRWIDMFDGGKSVEKKE